MNKVAPVRNQLKKIFKCSICGRKRTLFERWRGKCPKCKKPVNHFYR